MLLFATLFWIDTRMLSIIAKRHSDSSPASFLASLIKKQTLLDKNSRPGVSSIEPRHIADWMLLTNELFLPEFSGMSDLVKR